jgi:hypothetical protein
LLNIQRITGRLVRTDGSEIAEAAVVLPLVFMLLLGIVWFGRAFNIYSTIQQAAQQGAITAARATCATCASPNSFPAAGAVDNAVTAVLQASNLDASQIQPPAGPALPACPSPPAPSSGTCTATTHSISVCSNMWLNSTASTQPPQCGTVVSFQYPFQFYLPFTSLNMQNIILSAQAQSRMEN